MSRSLVPLAIAVLAALAPCALPAATYDVGPGQPLAAVGDVPWEALGAGDVVNIHWRTAPYREKFTITRQGTAGAPIVVRGIPGPAGELPVLDGDGATTRLALDTWSETRCVVKIGGSSVPADLMPQHVVIEGLEIRGARDTSTFTDDGGTVRTYDANASAIYVEKGENIVVRGCVMHDCGNGLFVASSDAAVSRDILVESNRIFDNGNVGSIFEHNNYTAALNITFQHNWFGPTLAGAGGNNLKDRSAGLVVRHNWIEGGNRQLDLVDAEDTGLLVAEPAYRDTWVYGNVLVETEGSGNRQVVHYGGDSGTTAGYRKGTLHFYNNTVVSTRTDRTTLFRLSTNEERCDARNNAVVTLAAPGSTLSMIDVSGVLDWSHGFLRPGWAVSFGAFGGTFNDDGTSVESDVPGFVDAAAQDFHLAAGSPCIDAGTSLEPAALPDHDVVAQYVRHQASEPRPRDAVLDIGAYEHSPGLPPVAGFVGSPLSGVAPLSVAFTDRSSGGPTEWAWDFEDDGAVDDATPSPTHDYLTPGIYTVRLAVRNATGADEVARVAYVCVAAGVPSRIADLRLLGNRRTLTWSPAAFATTHDVVRGDLLALPAGWVTAVQACVVDDGVAVMADDPTLPPTRGGLFYLVRGSNCAAEGSYDSLSAMQRGSRDAGIASSASACP